MPLPWPSTTSDVLPLNTYAASQAALGEDQASGTDPLAGLTGAGVDAGVNDAVAQGFCGLISQLICMPDAVRHGNGDFAHSEAVKQARQGVQGVHWLGRP